MTIEEKAGQLFQTVGAMYDDEAVISGPMQEMGITEKDIQLAGTVLGTMGAEKIKSDYVDMVHKDHKDYLLFALSPYVHIPCRLPPT